MPVRDRPEDHIQNTAGYEEWSNARLHEISNVGQGGQNTSVLGIRSKEGSEAAQRLIKRNEMVNAMFPQGETDHAHAVEVGVRVDPVSGQETPYINCYFAGNPSHYHYSYRDGDDILTVMEAGHVHPPLVRTDEPSTRLKVEDLREPLARAAQRVGAKSSVDELLARLPTSPERSTPMDEENKTPESDNATEQRIAALEADNKRGKAILDLPKDQQDHVRGLADDAARDAFLAKSEDERKDEVMRANIDPSQRVEFKLAGRSYNSIDNPDLYVAHLAMEEQAEQIRMLTEDNAAVRATEEAKEFFSHCRTGDTALTVKVYRLLKAGLTEAELAETDKMFRSMTAVASSESNVFDINTGRAIDSTVELDIRENTAQGLKDAAQRKINDLAEELRQDDKWKDKTDSQRRLEVMRVNPDLKQIVDGKATLAA